MLCDLWVIFFDEIYGVIKLNKVSSLIWQFAIKLDISFLSGEIHDKLKHVTRHWYITTSLDFKIYKVWGFLLCSYFSAYNILGSFVKPLRKLNISIVTCLPSVRLLLRMEKFDSHWSEFHEIYMVKFLMEICRENSNSIKTT